MSLLATVFVWVWKQRQHPKLQLGMQVKNHAALCILLIFRWLHNSLKILEIPLKEGHEFIFQKNKSFALLVKCNNHQIVRRGEWTEGIRVKSENQQ